MLLSAILHCNRGSIALLQSTDIHEWDKTVSHIMYPLEYVITIKKCSKMNDIDGYDGDISVFLLCERRFEFPTGCALNTLCLAVHLNFYWDSTSMSTWVLTSIKCNCTQRWQHSCLFKVSVPTEKSTTMAIQLQELVLISTLQLCLYYLQCIFSSDLTLQMSWPHTPHF